MVAITLSTEQIRSAPIEVRRWIERELVSALGFQVNNELAQPPHEHLVACDVAEAASILSLIQGMLPVVNVFFELGRQGASVGKEGIEAFRLIDIVQHTRLSGVDQAAGCLEIINGAMRRLRNDDTATLYVLNQRGDCIVATQTQQSIARLWEQIVGGSERPATERAEAPGLRMPSEAPQAAPFINPAPFSEQQNPPNS